MDYIIGIYIVIGCITAIDGIISLNLMGKLVPAGMALKFIMLWPRYWKCTLIGTLILYIFIGNKDKTENETD